MGDVVSDCVTRCYRNLEPAHLVLLTRESGSCQQKITYQCRQATLGYTSVVPTVETHCSPQFGFICPLIVIIYI